MERHFKEITTLAADLDLLCGNRGIDPGSVSAEGRPWPDAAVDLVRFGASCHLGLFRTLHLLVKRRWEGFVLDEKRPVPCDADDASSLRTFEENALARLLDRFRLSMGRGGAEEIHRLLEAHGGMASESGYDAQRLSTLVDQMIVSRVHCCGAGSPELMSFEARQEQELALLRQARREEEYEFWLKKSCWLTIQGELEDKLLLREDVRLKHFNVTMEWMALFGPTYIEALEAQTRCHELERRIAILKAEPALDQAELDRRVKEGLAEELASVEKMREDAWQAAAIGLGSEGEVLFDERLDRYLDEAKKLIREIWRLTHPDMLSEAFTESQRGKLREYFERVVKIRKSEAQLDVRAIPVLKEILASVKELYDVMGIDLEPESVIRGETLAEQTAWLEAEIRRIEAQIEELMAEIQAMSMDPDIREKVASMASEEAREETSLELERLKQTFAERTVDLQAEYRAVLAARAPAANP